MNRKNFRKTSSRVEFLLGLLVLAFLVYAPTSTQAVSDLSIPLSKINPYLSQLNNLKSHLSSSLTLAASQTANIFTTFTDNLRDAWEAYTSSPKDEPAPPLPIPPVITVATPPPIITDQALLKALRILFAQGDLQEFRGARGPEGPQGIAGSPGPQGIPGPAGSGGSSSVTYIPSNPSTNFGGASIFSVTDLSANKLIAETGKITTLEVTGNSTLTGTLNVGGATTLAALTATSFTIGANTLNTTEWAFLDGVNQTLATTSSPTFNVLTVTSCTGCSPTTSLALSTAISDETGSGALVFANTPTLVTPVLGVATATSIAIGANVVDTNE